MKYGLLKYRNTNNLGDEIQSIAVRRFLTTVDAEIDRDRLASFDPEDGQRYKVVCNGWFGHYPTEWPPSRSIDPLLISLHINRARSMQGILPEDIMLHDDAIEYMRHFGPVGARDLATLELLEEASVPAYFSGCVTLTLQKRNITKRDDLIVVCDVPDAALNHIRSKTNKTIYSVSVVGRSFSSDERFAEAQDRLDLFESASCVITSRLHVALPCLALGTPVFMIDTAGDQYRFSGLSSFYRHGTLDEFLSGSLFNVENPAPNDVGFVPVARKIEQTISAFLGSPEDVRPATDFAEARINAVSARLTKEVQKAREQERVISELWTKLNDTSRVDQLLEQLTTRDAEVERLKLACVSLEAQTGQLQELRQQAQSRVDLLEESLVAKDSRIVDLESLLKTFEMRAVSIRRISSFEVERLKEINSALSSRLSAAEAANLSAAEQLRDEHAASVQRQHAISIIDLEEKLRLAADEVLRYRQYHQEISTSRAHRIAALYIRSAVGRNPLSKAMRSGWAFVCAAARAARRRFR